MHSNFGRALFTVCFVLHTGPFIAVPSTHAELPPFFRNLSKIPTPIAHDEAEPTIAVDPTDSDVMVVAAPSLNLQGEMNVWRTEDAGLHWMKSTTTIGDAFDGLGSGKRGDPSLAFAPDGTLYLAYIVTVSGQCSGRPKVVICAKSTDAAVTFEEFTIVHEECASDKAFIGIGPNPAGTAYHVYVAYDVGTVLKVVRMTTEGSPFQFQAPVTLLQTGTFAQPIVAADGTVVVIFHNKADSPTGSIRASRSLDGGATFLFPVQLGPTTVHRSTQVPPAPARGIHAGPTGVVDRSGGPFHGRFSVAYVVSEDGEWPVEDTNIVVQTSDDGGATWTGARFLNSGSFDFQFLPWLAIDQTTGAVVCLYLDTRQSGTLETKPWASVSFNGSAGWTQRLFADIETDNSCNMGFSINYLEYHGVVVADGLIRGVWAGDPDEGECVTSVRKDILYSFMPLGSFSDAVAVPEPGSNVSSPVPFPNPSAHGVDVTVDLPASEGAGPQDHELILEVFDVAGRRVREVALGPHGPGEHRIRWDGTDASGRHTPGVYLVRVSAGSGVLYVGRVVLVR